MKLYLLEERVLWGSFGNDKRFNDYTRILIYDPRLDLWLSSDNYNKVSETDLKHDYFDERQLTYIGAV